MDTTNSGKSSASDSYLKVDTAGSSSGDTSPRSTSPSAKGLNLFRMISQRIARGSRKSKDGASSTDEDDLSNSEDKKDDCGGGGGESRECDCDYFCKRRDVVVLTAKSRSNSFAADDNAKRSNGKSGEYATRCLRFATPSANPSHSSGSDPYSSNDDSCDGDGHGPRFSSNDSSASSSSGSYRASRAIVRKVLKTLNLNSRSLSCSSISHAKDVTGSERRDATGKDKKGKKSPQKILRQPVTYTYVRGISGLPTHRVVNTRGCYNNQYSRG